LYGSHRSITIFSGRLGSGAIRSTTTLRGGGGIRLPEIVIRFTPILGGGVGGASRTIKGTKSCD